MDINPPSDLETSKHMIIWSQGFDQNLVETKSFKCTFCKRGFSNAQALGGHMNIHRKDRAKLKELSLDVVVVDRKHSPPPADSSSTAKRLLSSEKDESPFDVKENPDRAGEEEEEAERGRFDKHVEGTKVELNYGELDLELRLGPEPHHAKPKP